MAHRRKLFRSFIRALHVDVGKVTARPGGSLKVNLPTSCTVNVTPLNPHTSDWNFVHVALQVPESNDVDSTDDSAARNLIDSLGISLHSEVADDRSYVRLEAMSNDAGFSQSGLNQALVVDVSLPGLFDVDLKTQSGAVNINGTIEGDVKIHSADAAVNIEKLKSMHVDVDIAAGVVSAGVIQGSVSIRTGTGDISIGKIQGPEVSLETSSGGIRARAMYTEHAVIQSGKGSILVDGAQGNTKILTGKGDVVVSGVQGNLTVESDSGNVSAQLSRPEDVLVRTTTGDVSLGIPETSEAKVVLHGTEGIDIDQEIRLKEVSKDADAHSIRGVCVPTTTLGQRIGRSVWGSARAQTSKIEARASSGKVRLCVEKWSARLTDKVAQG